MKIRRKRWAIALLGVAVLELASCSRRGEEADLRPSVKIAYLPIAHALPVFETAEASANGGDLNVELVKFGSWPELLDALNSERVDGASVLIEPAMKAKERGVGL